MMRLSVRCGLWAVVALADVFRASGETVLFDFEREAERNAVACYEKNGASLSFTDRLAPSGEWAIRLACEPWREGYSKWPSFTLPTECTDWRQYDRMVIELVSLRDAPSGLFYLYVCGPKGLRQKWLHASRDMSRTGYQQWVVPLKKWDKDADRGDVRKIHFYSVSTTHPKGHDIIIDRIALLKSGEPLPVPQGPCVMRDILPMVLDEKRELQESNLLLRAELAHLPDYLRFCDDAARSPFASASMAVGTATSMENVLPRDAFPSRPVPADGLRVRLARNEYESVQVLVAPLGRDLKNVRLCVSELLGVAGCFASTNISCDVTGYVKTTGKPPYSVGCNVPTNAAPGYRRIVREPVRGWWPDPILDFLDGVDVKGRDVQSFWVRVKCPEKQPKGEYSGTLTVSADGVAPVKIPFSVRVNGFTLERRSMLPLALTFSPHDYGMGPDLWKDPRAPVQAWRHRRDEWVDFLADYLIPMDRLYHKDGVQFDVLERLRRQGRMGLFNLGYWTYPSSTNASDMAKWREGTLVRLRKDYDEAKRRGILGSAYVYGCDEVPRDKFNVMRAAVRELKTALPGIPVFTTAYDDDFGVGTQLDVMDWFTPLTPKFDPAKAALSRAKGHRVWWYVCMSPKAPYANMFIECPAIEGRLLMGAQTVRMRPDGFLYYQLSVWNSLRYITSGPFTDWDPRSWMTYHGDGAWTCVGPKGKPLATIRLENFRDGLEDYAYAKILERKLAERECKDNVWVQAAKELLSVPKEVMDTMTNYTDDPMAVYRWRNAMADLIDEVK